MPQPTTQSSPTPGPTANVDVEDVEMLVGEEYIEETLAVPTVGDDVITDKERGRLHKFLSQTIRPTWHAAPPRNLGEKRHSKLKADQLRSCIEFDIPTAIAQLWASDVPVDESTRRRKLLVKSTILLATAIRWATSRRTSEHHVSQYMSAMVAYYGTLKELYPALAWRPNHHASLHIGPFLLLFGPMHGWWMFVYERIIGLLQKINTNYKIGKY